ncbi:MAG: glycoside hydrolase family 30 protein [Myxococcota bacterium]
MTARIFSTSRAGDALTERRAVHAGDSETALVVRVHGDRERQRFFGIGSSLTQSSAAALAAISPAKRQEVLERTFGRDGAAFALSRTHIASSDFSEESYVYVAEEDPSLESFTIEPDRDNGLLQLLKDAQATPGADFDLISSPWSPPPWMKDNGKLYDPENQTGGRLLREHYGTFARYFVKYLEAYAAEGIDVWGITPINEPQGNNGNWESMHMSPEEQRDFLRVLGPTLREAGMDTRVLIFDQNRAEMPEYTEVVHGDPKAGAHTFGTAVHWYNSTFKVYEDVLEAEHARHPDKPILQTEGTIDSVSAEASCNGQCLEPPCGCEPLYTWWQNDDWYWEKEATDWGWDWAPPDQRADHPKYSPAFRYARDIVVGMAHWIAGWVDWNVVLDKRGGPNHVSNFCLAPVMVDGPTDTVYYSPTYFILAQLSRHSRPGGVVLETEVSGAEGVHATAIRNPDGTVAVHVFSEAEEDLEGVVEVAGERFSLATPGASLQTLVVSGR